MRLTYTAIVQATGELFAGAAVYCVIQRLSDSKYWDGSDWDSAVAVPLLMVKNGDIWAYEFTGGTAGALYNLGAQDSPSDDTGVCRWLLEPFIYTSDVVPTAHAVIETQGVYCTTGKLYESDDLTNYWKPASWPQKGSRVFDVEANTLKVCNGANWLTVTAA